MLEGLSWIAADWGTSNLRLWAMNAEDRVLAEGGSPAGMGGLARDAFAPTFAKATEGWTGGAQVPAVICGMAGSRQGWVEAPYGTVPAKPLDTAFAAVPGTRAWIVPGLKQASPADVMRGEETQIAGFLRADPGFDGVLCLPGTHTKWVHISAEEVVSFRTFMSGELFALLADHSVLRHSVTTDGWADTAFREGVDDITTAPERLAARLFTLRADGLLNGTAAEVARARLSGLLIGAELAAAKPYWLGQRIVILGAPDLSRLYRQALDVLGAPAEVTDATEATLNGLRAAHARLKESTG